MMEDHASVDAYAPGDMAARVEAGGVAKANLDMATILALAVLAGAFIALGANFATIVLTDTGVGYGLSRLAGGLVFSLGLILVLVGGAELFTGDILMVMAWASGKISPHDSYELGRSSMQAISSGPWPPQPASICRVSGGSPATEWAPLPSILPIRKSSMSFSRPSCSGSSAMPWSVSPSG